METIIILKLIDSLIARGFDAARWAQNRQVVKAQLEAWHEANATDEEKLASIDALVDRIHANSDILQARLSDTDPA